MKIGWTITISVDEYHKLLHDGKVTFGEGGAIYLRQAQDPKVNEYFGVVGFDFGVKDLPPRSLMMQWLDAFYDGNAEKFLSVTEQIKQHQLGKKALEKIEG